MSPPGPLCYSPFRTLREYGIGTTLAYEVIGHGDLPHVRLGRTLRLPRIALEEWIAAETLSSGHRQVGPVADHGSPPQPGAFGTAALNDRERE